MAATNLFGLDPMNGNKPVMEKSLISFLAEYGNVSNLDTSKLPEELRPKKFLPQLSKFAGGNDSYLPLSGDGGDDGGASFRDMVKAAESDPVYGKYKDFKVKELGQDDGQYHLGIVNPAGKILRTTLKKDKDSWFDSFMYSGGPIALMAAPIAGPALGSALGLTGTTASVVGSSLVNAGITGAATGSTKAALRSGVGSAAAGGLSAIPGFSKLPTFAQGAARGATSTLVQGGDPRAALLSALMGGVTSGANSGLRGMGAPAPAANFVTSLLRQMLQQKVAPKRQGPGRP